MLKKDKNDLYRLLNEVRKGCENTSCKICLFYEGENIPCILQAALKCAIPTKWIDPAIYENAKSIRGNLVNELSSIRKMCVTFDACSECPFVAEDCTCFYTKVLGSAPTCWNLDGYEKKQS